MSLPDMTPAQLMVGAQEIYRRLPDAVLVKNKVGNLAVVLDGVYWGWLDLRNGSVTWLDGEDEQG